jgi:hypothetical protein
MIALTRPVLISFLLVATQALAASDIPGAADPLGIDRYPRSWIVLYDQDDELANRDFIVSRVDKTRRDVRVKREVRALATSQSATYQMPSGTRPQDVVDHYLQIFGRGEVFSCQGRDCGRSNHWANYIFEQAILYGPDVNQHYFAGELEDHLVSLYVIERGNKRVYAHLQILTPQTPVAVEHNLEVVERLSSEGYVVLETVRPEADGGFEADARQILEALGPVLVGIGSQQVYVVCHLYGAAATEALLANAARCSETATELLSSAEGPQLVPFAAGPLLPRRTGNVSRIELVLPHRLDHN